MKLEMALSLRSGGIAKRDADRDVIFYNDKFVPGETARNQETLTYKIKDVFVSAVATRRRQIETRENLCIFYDIKKADLYRMYEAERTKNGKFSDEFPTDLEFFDYVLKGFSQLGDEITEPFYRIVD